eukprot:4432243-Pyramimonas_sp.AAC.1
MGAMLSELGQKNAPQERGPSAGGNAQNIQGYHCTIPRAHKNIQQARRTLGHPPRADLDLIPRSD